MEFGVPPRHRDVVQKDVALRMPPGRGEVLVDEKLRPGVGPTLDHQESLTPLKLALR